MGKAKALEIIKKYYDEDSDAYKALIMHGEMVCKKALAIAARVPELKPDLDFIEEAAYLHDIGIKFTQAEDIGCEGKEHYLRHGILGKEILEKEGLPRHARIAARHLGIGLRKEDIREKNLPLPEEDFHPETIEEEIIAFADEFYSKIPGRMHIEKSKEKIRARLIQFGERHQRVFDAWCEKYKE